MVSERDGAKGRHFKDGGAGADAERAGAERAGGLVGPGEGVRMYQPKPWPVARMRRPFLTELTRSIGTTWTRFLAIVGIVGLGVGFYAGLNMTGRDMRLAADAYYDGTYLYDLRVISTLGLTDSQLDRIERVEGVESVTGGYAADVVALMGGKRYALRMMSCDMDAARESVANGRGSAVKSDDDTYLNRPVLAKGDWPSGPDECLLCADSMLGDTFTVGDTVEVIYGTSSLDGVLSRRSFVVSGMFHSSYFPSSTALGYTNLGAGMISQCMLVSPEAFSSELPYTEVFVAVEGARDLESGSDEYRACVDETAERLRDLGLGALRLSQIRGDAEAELAEAQQTYDDEKAKAEAELDNGAQELADARARLEEGEAALAEGRKQYEAGLAEYLSGSESAEREFAAARAKLANGAAALARAEKQLGMSQADIDAAATEVENGLRELDEAEKQLGMTQADIDAKRAEVERGRRALEDAESQLGMTQGDINAKRAEAEKARRRLDDAEAQLGMTQADIDAKRAELESGRKTLEEAEAQLGMTQADIDAKRAELEEGKATWNEQREKLTSVREQVSTMGDALAALSELVALNQLPSLEEIASASAKVASALNAASELEQLGVIDLGSEETRALVEEAAQEVYDQLKDIDFSQGSEQIIGQLRDLLPQNMAKLISTVDSTLTKIDEGIAQGDALIADATDKLDQAQAARDAIDKGRAELEDGEKKLAQAQEARDAIDKGRAQLEEGLALLDQAQAARDAIEEGRAELDRAEALLDQAQAARDAIDAGRAKAAQAAKMLDKAREARKTIDAGYQELAEGRRQYQSEKAKVDAQLAAARQTLAAAAEQLAASSAELESGRAEYERGLAAWRDGRAELESRLADAAAQMAAARAEIDEIEEPSIYVLDRTYNAGVQAQYDDTLRVDVIASVFPFIFFLVAALVSLTTMTRMVEDERIDIGTHKALGFSTPRITSKYVCYAGLAGLVGGAFFIALLSQLLPWVVQVAYNIIYSVPIQPFPLPIDTGLVLLSLGIGLGVIFVAILGAAGSTLREVPASLLLPRAPKAGKRILLERIGPVWSRLSFSWKVTFRNLFRYKQRMAMTIVGIAGCTALLLTGFGMHDALWDVIAYQYESENPVFRSNVTLGMNADATEEDIRLAEQLLVASGNATDIARLDMRNMQVSSETHDGASAIRVFIVDDYPSLSRLVDVRDRRSGDPIEVGPTSVVMSEKMARRLGLKVGDTLTLYEQDEIGNPKGDGYEFVLDAICENYIYNYLYLGADAWREATGTECVANSLLARADTDDEARTEMAEAFASDDAVSYVSFVTESIDTFRTSLKAINMIVIVLVVAAAALAFIVLYNLTNIQLIERMREIASLKVLGFNRREVVSYLFRETILLVLVAALVGLVAGTFLEGYVITTAEIDAVMFGRDIHLASYLISFALTFVFSLIVMAIISPKLHAIDMVESLKSVD